MTLPAAVFGTAVRVLRTAAGRRALQLAMLVGGLFLLGFLCGEQAHAADGTPVAPVPSLTSVRPVGGQHEDAVRTVTERVVTDRVVTDRVVTPVRKVVQTASHAFEGTRAEAPALPTTSAVPSMPLPKLPKLPEVSEELPVHPLPAPVTPEPRADRPGSSAPAADQGDRARTEARTAVSARPPAAVYGPDFAPPAHVLRAPAQLPVHRAASAVDAPAQPAPTGDPDGVLGKQAADGTASRHGDAYAVTLDGRAPLRLLPGTAARVDAPGTRERHRDIPVFPG
ncbi:hypothetical protein BEK98_06415 [Streptomyces diastatochromogenes]|uniref:Uncharacterized protein n=1 Tax=Streptomyces diastatochromogenes TaxID=42236 RepID=A0A233SS70_STRDA|nr:hypothetical protein BEK98_06415 [Streptomyces diastatochromogenes]